MGLRHESPRANGDQIGSYIEQVAVSQPSVFELDSALADYVLSAGATACDIGGTRKMGLTAHPNAVTDQQDCVYNPTTFELPTSACNPAS